MIPRVLVFAGSLRTGAFSIATADAAMKELALQGAEVTRISLADYPLPIMDQDLERQNGIPENAYRLARHFVAHDGLVHQRWPFKYVPRKGYLRRLYQAHRLHHAVEGRDGCVSFGFVYAPPLDRLKDQLRAGGALRRRAGGRSSRCSAAIRRCPSWGSPT